MAVNKRNIVSDIGDGKCIRSIFQKNAPSFAKQCQ